MYLYRRLLRLNSVDADRCRVEFRACLSSSMFRACFQTERDKVKARVKNLCKILQSSEMKEKAELASDCAHAFLVRDEAVKQVQVLLNISV